MKPRRAAFLDRDGVLIRHDVRSGRPYAITDGEEVDILDGVPEACAMLSAAGFLLIMITNQPDVATGRTSRAFVEQTNSHLVNALSLDSVEVCFHDDDDGCDCRKPKPGMLLGAAARFGLDLPNSVMIGDRWRDIEAGRSAGCRTVLIDYGYVDRQPPPPDYITASLLGAAKWLLNINAKDANDSVA